MTGIAALYENDKLNKIKHICMGIYDGFKEKVGE